MLDGKMHAEATWMLCMDWVSIALLVAKMAPERAMANGF
jgi:hypothetical protein